MDALSERYGFIAVYPRGFDDSWNAGGNCFCGFASFVDADEQLFTETVLDDLEQRFCVDTSRVFLSGQAIGGMLALGLGCSISERIAAVGAVDGAEMVIPCEASRPVPAMIIAASDWSQDQQSPEFWADAFQTWASTDRCGDGDATAVVCGNDAMQCVEHAACDQGTVVRRCTPTPTASPAAQWEGLVRFFTAHSLP